MHDLVIRGGTIVDGSGAESFTGDVAVDNGRITSVSSEPGTIGRGHREVMANGLLITPGFVDVHTHYDAQATWDAWLTPSSWHGVTTAVMGNCGVGFAPAAADRHEWLIGLMEGVEDIPGAALTAGISWDWTTYPEYLDALAGHPRVLDVGSMMTHGALRAFVMGDSGADNSPATIHDIESMRALVAEGLAAGALGFSTSRTPIHRSIWGKLVPGTTAADDEIFGIGEALAACGGRVFQFAPEHVRAIDEMPWMIELARRSGCTVSINLNQTDAAPDIWREVLEAMTSADAGNGRLVAQVAGRAIGMVLCFDGSVHPFLDHPAWLEIAALPIDQRRAAVSSSAFRERLIAEPSGLSDHMMGNAHKYFAAQGGVIDYEPDASSSIQAQAVVAGVTARQKLVESLCADGGRGMVYAPLFNYANGHLGHLAELHRHPNTRMGLSDAGAHCGVICDGAMPSFMLTHWARDRSADAIGGQLGLEHVVHRQTAQTAELYGLGDRGLLRPGLRADINIIDFDALTIGPAQMVFDFPANARRLVQRANGYVGTWCAGAQTIDHDEFTGELPGRLIRGPR